MKTLLVFLTGLHASLHLVGFLQATGLKNFKALALSFSKTDALPWLGAALLLIAYLITVLLSWNKQWMVGVSAILLSQVLIIRFWADARMGTLQNLLIATAVLVQFGGYRLYRAFEKRVQPNFTANNPALPNLLTEADIRSLPAPVQRYLRYTQSVGKPKIDNFRASFSGGMWSDTGQRRMPFHSVQYNFIQQPSRYFYMKAYKTGVPATGVHVYENQAASFRVLLGNWLPVVDARGEKMNQSETVTLFNDMCTIAPATLIDPRIEWTPVDDFTTNAVFANGRIRVTATLFFNAQGALENFVSNDRYHTDGKNYYNYPWSTPLSHYRFINGYRLPGRAKLLYSRPGGAFMYGELFYENVQYNVRELHRRP